MANEKRVENIADMNTDFAQWYTDVVKKADLADYSETGGCIIFRPYGYALWEFIQKDLDARFKETGHENVYMPLLIPERLIQMEQEHVEGFAPELFWVTKSGEVELSERLCLRPTSETLFCSHFANIIQSWRDLPLLYNQWCSVFRCEKTTRPFLRTREFLWQEGHTAHASEEEAREETLRMLDVYTRFTEETLAIPVLRGLKTEREKFAGAVATYTFESMMHDGVALQSGTSHYLGMNFARQFNIQYLDKNNKLQYIHQSSWGVSSRLIGAVIMVHGDNNGLILPPGVAPVQIMVIPIAAHREGVLDKAEELRARLSKHFRCRMDISDKSPGWMFSEHEMRGVPLRLEIGPKDIENDSVVLARRDTGEKITAPLGNLETVIKELLQSIRDNMFAKASQRQNERTYTAMNVGELKEILNAKPGFINAMWCGGGSCEQKVKDETTATSRCIPFEQERIAKTCFCCGKKAEHMVVWGRAY